MKHLFANGATVIIALVIGFFHAATLTFFQIEATSAYHAPSGIHNQPSIANGCQIVCQGGQVRVIEDDGDQDSDDQTPATPQPYPTYATILDDLASHLATAGFVWTSASWTPPDIITLGGLHTAGR